MPYRDYQVATRAEEGIALIAKKLRLKHHQNGFDKFDIVEFVEMTLLHETPRGFTLELDSSLEEAAYVRQSMTGGHSTLYVCRSVWEGAKQGVRDDVFVIAHEAGHLMLHDILIQSFSNSDEDHRPKFVTQAEDSAEWQANKFADHLLAPSEIIQRVRDPEMIMTKCRVSRSTAERRVRDVAEEDWRYKYEGDACPECCNFTVIRTGTRLKCRTCRISYEE